VSPLTMAVDVIPPAEPVSWLFVEDAAVGSLTGPDDQHLKLKLKLKNVRKNILAIAAGPIPQAVALPNEEFFTAWQQMFPVGPATAFLSYDLPGKSQPRNIVLTLTNPYYDAVKRTVTFDAESIPFGARGTTGDYILSNPAVGTLTDATLTIFNDDIISISPVSVS